MKPQSLLKLINAFKELPGISKKQAEKIAFHIINSHDDIGKELSQIINETKKQLRHCNICGHLTDATTCDICFDKNRQKILIIVETPIDVFKFEDTQTIKPHYHVLHGLVNVSKRTGFEDLNIANLKERAKNYSEIVLALSSNLEGIVTASLIAKMLSDFNVTQLAQGIPLGAAMDYVDEITLKAAIDNRKEMK